MEIPLTGTTETTGSDTSTGKGNINSAGDAASPQTGENSILGVMSCAVSRIAGGLALTAIVMKKKKHSKQ